MPSMISLDGQFKADIYNPSNELIQSGEWAGNYITSTGLCYPLTMPFADTFRFLSLGSGKQANDLFTTGLYSGSKPLIYQTSPPGHNFLWTTGVVGGGCGYQTTNSGVELYRAWRIPENGGFLDEDLHVSELMTSPNTTGMDGTSGTSYPHPFNGGKFSDPHSGVTAFNRILRDFSIPSGDYAVITYRLSFIIDSAVRTFEPFVGLNNAAGVGKTTWQKLTGKGRVLHPGIQLIKGVGGGNEEGGEDGASPGESYKLEFGEPMEPSASGNMYAYFTTDNTQYRFDPFWGGAAYTGLQVLKDPSNGSLHWTHTGVNIATGFPEYFHNMPDILEMSDDNEGGGGDDPKHLHDLHSSSKRTDRFTKFRRIGSKIPTSTNFLTEQVAGQMGNAGYNENVIVTSLNHDLAISYTGQTHHSRSRDMTRVMGWQTVNAIGDPGAPGTWISYKSLVFCADKGKHADSLNALTDSQIAFFDSQFGTYDSANYPNNGEYLVTISSTGAFPYGTNDGKPKFTQPPKAYPFHDNQNGLSMTWKLTWSAPCGEVAGGCSDNLYKTKTACQNASKLWTDCVDP
jgi:hypothetical protein